MGAPRGAAREDAQGVSRMGVRCCGGHKIWAGRPKRASLCRKSVQ